MNREEFDKIFNNNTNGKLEQILEFAKEHPHGESLNDCFKSLQQICENNKEYYEDTVELYTDWAPYSLTFAFKLKGQPEKAGLSGGIIYHGSVKGKKVQNLSVTLNPCDGWRIHT